MFRTLITVVLIGSMLSAGACEKKVEDPVVHVSGDDPRMLAATAEAKRRWPEFVQHFKNKKPGRAYAVKLAFPIKSGGSEHCWIQVSGIKGDEIIGVLNNIPANDIGYQNGDQVRTTVDKVEDWLVANGSDDMIGAFTAKAIEEIQAGKP